jgi:hypothetical protein
MQLKSRDLSPRPASLRSLRSQVRLLHAPLRISTTYPKIPTARITPLSGFFSLSFFSISETFRKVDHAEVVEVEDTPLRGEHRVAAPGRCAGIARSSARAGSTPALRTIPKEERQSVARKGLGSERRATATAGSSTEQRGGHERQQCRPLPFQSGGRLILGGQGGIRFHPEGDADRYEWPSRPLARGDRLGGRRACRIGGAQRARDKRVAGRGDDPGIFGNLCLARDTKAADGGSRRSIRGIRAHVGQEVKECHECDADLVRGFVGCLCELYAAFDSDEGAGRVERRTA